MQQEKIQYSQSRTGTTIQFFSNFMPSSTTGSFKAFAIIDATNNVLQIVDTKKDAQYTRNPDNTFSFNPNALYVGGYSTTQTLDFVLSSDRQTLIQNNFFNSITNGQIPSGQTISDAISAVFFNNTLIDDMYVNISLNRDYGILDTLSVQNVINGQMPLIQSPTGVVFGKLNAFQKLIDASGNTITIPLANVPIAIFNSSDEFPSISSVDSNGNRIRLNVEENSPENLYVNQESFLTDQSFLTNELGSQVIPNKFLYSTITNANGEFLLTDVPIGSQVLLFEVDLLKQGLTADEIALNFFPYPVTPNPNVDTIPSYFFQQLAVNIVPSWGNYQTGYTEVDISVNLDLRKWTTYIFPPVSVGGQNLETSVAQSSSNSLKIQIRDMTQINTNNSGLTLVEASKITNDLNRQDLQQYLWYNEFPSNILNPEFTVFSCPVLKLVANLYDPNAFKTDKNGDITNNPGVWLTSYEFNMFVNGNVNRKTGAVFNFSDFTVQSHFDLNHSDSTGFPYQKPWSISYPNNYSIPKRPTQYNNNPPIDSNGNHYANYPKYADGDLVGAVRPTILELSNGVNADNPTGGFGLQTYIDFDNFNNFIWIANRISQVATSSLMYKYEQGVAWNESYANGFRPNDSSETYHGISTVINGEKYQRLECGYGYFMKPQGWPRIVLDPYTGCDTTSPLDTSSKLPGGGLTIPAGSPNPGPGISQIRSWYGINYTEKNVNDVYNLNNQNLALCLDSNAHYPFGTIDIYRIVDSGSILNPITGQIINKLSTPTSYILPTFIKLNFAKENNKRLAAWSLTNNGITTISFGANFNTGGFLNLNFGDAITLKPGEFISQQINYASGTQTQIESITSTYNDTTHNINHSQTTTSLFGIDNGKTTLLVNLNDRQPTQLWYLTTFDNFTSIILPGNSAFNTAINEYGQANYTFVATANGDNENGIRIYSIPINHDALTIIPDLYIQTSYDGGAHGHVSNGVNTDVFKHDDVETGNPNIASVFLSTTNAES